MRQWLCWYGLLCCGFQTSEGGSFPLSSLGDENLMLLGLHTAWARGQEAWGWGEGCGQPGGGQECVREDSKSVQEDSKRGSS